MSQQTEAQLIPYIQCLLEEGLVIPEKWYSVQFNFKVTDEKCAKLVLHIPALYELGSEEPERLLPDPPGEET